MSQVDLSIQRPSDLANPTKFLHLSGKLLPWMWGITLILFVVGLYMSFTAPEDYQQGITVQIMFIHVPAAWLCMMSYTVMTISSIGTLVWRHPLADVASKAAAPLGAAFTIIALITGSLWGRPMWGAWWVWDARLTSVFVLLLMYLGLMALTRAMDDPSRSAKTVAIITIVGWVNIPIIKFSVDWWNTLHQPASVVRLDGPTIHPTLLYPLLVMAIAFSMLFFTLHFMAMRNEIWRRRVRSLRRLQREQWFRKGQDMSHEMFVFLSYAAVVVVLGIVILWIILDGKARKAELARLEAAGVKRRSEQNT